MMESRNGRMAEVALESGEVEWRSRRKWKVARGTNNGREYTMKVMAVYASCLFSLAPPHPPNPMVGGFG